MRDVLTFILAGGKGERLLPLTRDRAKPAVPFGGHYRIIDFALSSCVHSNLRRIFILTQYKSLSLEEHVRDGWTVLSPTLDEFLQTVPPQQRTGSDWYLGTADAIHQNWYCVERFAMEHGSPSAILILAGDHVYKMDYRAMIDFHRAKDADATVAVLRLHRDEVRAKLGELVIDADSRAVAFEEKPMRPTGMPGEPDFCLASLGIYAFKPGVLRDELDRDAGTVASHHDFGRNVLPAMIGRRRVYAFPFELGNRNTGVYWRDVGTIDAYFDAHMDLVGAMPRFDLYDRSWPIHTVHRPKPPAKIVRGDGDATGVAFDSLVSSGAIVSGGTVVRSILSPGVVVQSGAHVEESVLLDRVVIGRGARVRRAILDKRAVVADDATIGYDAQADAEQFSLSEAGIVVVPKSTFPH
ncbi:MAG: glucose-1-phosphate adenylyltransferase [Candidatus Bipolaricaulota bacterium]